jgi:predicted Zn-dependent protease
VLLLIGLAGPAGASSLRRGGVPIDPFGPTGEVLLRGADPAVPFFLHRADPAAGDPREAPEPGPIRRREGSPDWPKDFEVGLQAARSFAYEFGLVEDDSLVQRVNRIGYKVASQAGRNDILFSFHIVNLPEPNALALPGGFIFVTKGMMDLDLPDEAMAHMFGHEITHVTHGHFSRAGRLSAATSLLQTAVLVAALLAVPSSTSGGYDRDPETGAYRTSLSGKEAAIEGTNIFGSVFRELLLRGYSRGLEMEADEGGRRLAGRAGYPMSGDVELLEELHRRIYEDQEFGYWQTHPYFTDRVERAKAAIDAGGTPPSEQEVNSYREKIQKRLAAIAESIEDEPTAVFLYRAALESGPGGEPSYEVEHKLLQLRAEKLRAKKPVLRAYGPLVADYDSLLARLDGKRASEEVVRGVRSDRDDLNRERAEIYPDSRKILDRNQAGIQFLELFLENYPEDPQAPAVRYRLAELYRLSDRPDAAALTLAGLSGLVRGNPQSPDSVVLPPPPASRNRGVGVAADPAATDSAARAWQGRSLEALRRVLPEVRELTTSQRILLAAGSDSVRSWAADRLKAQAAALDSLEVGSRFLQEYPASALSDQVREKLEGMAMQRYYAARLRESMQDFQAALDEYNALILLAPQTKAADMAREGIARIQSFANRS